MMRLMRGKGRDGRNILLGKSAATVFDCLLAVSPGQDDDWVELGVVQLVHCVGSNIEQGMAAPEKDIVVMHNVERVIPGFSIIYSFLQHVPVHDVADG